MKRYFNSVVVSFFVLVVAHVWITLYRNKGLVGGDYFSSGIILMSDGEILQASQRLYSDGPDLYIYYRVGSDYYELNFSKEYSIKEYVTYVNKVVRAPAMSATIKYADPDIAFSSSYASRPGSKLTLREIKTPYKSKCIYAYELSSVYCYGTKRLDEP